MNGVLYQTPGNNAMGTPLADAFPFAFPNVLYLMKAHHVNKSVLCVVHSFLRISPRPQKYRHGPISR